MKDFFEKYKLPIEIIGGLLALLLTYLIVVQPKLKYSSSIEFGRRAISNNNPNNNNNNNTTTANKPTA